MVMAMGTIPMISFPEILSFLFGCNTSPSNWIHYLSRIGFSVRLAVRSRPEKAEADDSTHEVRQIGGVEVRVSAEDRMFDQTTQPQVESKPEPQPVENSICHNV